MHYADGTEAKRGDLVKHTPTHENSQEVVGVLVHIYPAASSCNGNLQPLAARQKGTETWFPINGNFGWSVTIGECTKL